MRSYSTYCFLIMCFSMLAIACEKPEKLYTLPPRPTDSVSVYQLALGENYDNQVYINFLDKNPVKSSTKYNTWDLALDCSPHGSKVYMNGGKGVLVASLGKGMFSSNLSVSKLNWRWDEACGGDSIVLGQWCNAQLAGYDSVYVIDRGSDSPSDKRYYQFKLAIVLDNYAIEVADVKGHRLYTATVHKDQGKNATFFDFSKGEILNFEPSSNDWHFCFMRYRYVYYEFKPALLYYVTGININPAMISVAIDSSMKYEDIRLNIVEKLSYSSKRDVMGFDWKVYDFTKGHYNARKYVNYIIKVKNPQVAFYKLRFTDFYDDQGVKGSPKFEVSKVLK